MSKRTCGDAGGIGSHGNPCGTHIGLSDKNGLCIVHDPDRAGEWAERQSKGHTTLREGRDAEATEQGERKLVVPPAPKTLEDATRWASWLTRATALKEIDARTAEASTKALRQFQITIEKKELEDKVRELSAQVKALKAKAR